MVKKEHKTFYFLLICPNDSTSQSESPADRFSSEAQTDYNMEKIPATKPQAYFHLLACDMLSRSIILYFVILH